MINRIRYFILFLLLFIGLNVTNLFNFDYKYVLVLLLGLSAFVGFFCGNFKNKKLEIVIVLFVATYTLFKASTDASEGSRMLGAVLLVPPLILFSLPEYGNMNNVGAVVFWKKAFKLFLVFYFFECGVTIWENLFRTHIFGYIQTTLSSFNLSGFRSHAIHGHPLQNALIVSTVMTFILISPIKVSYKYFLWGLGYISILCFNTRSSIVGCALILVVYTIYQLFSKRASGKKGYYVFFLLVCLLISYYLMQSGRFGGRLLEMGLVDDSSAQVRIDIWSIFNYYSLSDFLWGINYEEFQYLLYSSGLHTTENFWIDWVLRYGLFFVIPFVFLYFLLVKKILKDYSFINKCFVGGGFLLLASTNNSLTSNFVPLAVFLLCGILFDPKAIRTNLKKMVYR